MAIIGFPSKLLDKALIYYRLCFIPLGKVVCAAESLPPSGCLP